jgi:glycerophosphoryl diester phosphodiesterase
MKTITMFSLGFAILFGVCSPSAADEGIDMPVRGICAHRGANVSHPENTLVAFKEAIRLGVHQIEFDVHLSKDKECVAGDDAAEHLADRPSEGRGRVGGSCGG